MIKFKPGNLRVPKFQRPVYVVAAGTTDYRKRYPEYKLEELCMMAFRMMLEENDLPGFRSGAQDEGGDFFEGGHTVQFYQINTEKKMVSR